MNEQMECMCLACGISVHLGLDVIALEEHPGTDKKLVKDIFCTQCGGQLALIGEAGKETHYRTH